MHQVQMLLHDERYLAALRAAGPLATDPERPAEERVEAALVAARAAAELSMREEARRWALLAKEQARKRDQVARANHYLGVILLKLHEPDEAETALLAALAHATLEQAARIRPAILANLATSYEQRHQDTLAIQVYRQAADDYLAAGQHHQAARCWQNAALLALLSEHPDDARFLLTLAGEHLAADTMRERANQQAMEAYAAYLSEDTQRAVEMAEELLYPGREGLNPWARGLAAITAIKIALAEGRADIARALVRNASVWVTEAECVKLCNLLADVRRQAGA